MLCSLDQRERSRSRGTRDRLEIVPGEHRLSIPGRF
jgi:hypothetical protein